MKKVVFALASLALVAPLSIANAAPDKPLHAARPTSGSGCFTRASESAPYQFNAACEYHQVVKRNKDGSLAMFIYQDKGDLLPGQTAPDSASKVALEATIGGLPCTGIEVVTPSGSYASNLKCTD